jgi:predicted hydrocarbon binding protein
VNRKQFVGALVTIGAGTAVGQTPPAPPADPQKGFREAWLKTLMEKMDAQLDEPSRIRLMEECGRACARRGAVAGLSKAAGGDLDKLLAAIGSHVGAENAKREGNMVRLRYTKCYCPLVSAGPERLPGTYCNCSRGWLLEVFGTVTGKPVKVEMVSSIKRGDAVCEFLIRT